MAAAQRVGLDEEDLGSIEVWAKLALWGHENNDCIQQGDDTLEDIELWVQAFLGDKDPPDCSHQDPQSKQVASLKHTSTIDSIFEAADMAAVPQLAPPHQLPGYAKEPPSLLKRTSSQPSPRVRKQRDQRFSCSRLPSIPEDSCTVSPLSTSDIGLPSRAEGHRRYNDI